MIDDEGRADIPPRVTCRSTSVRFDRQLAVDGLDLDISPGRSTAIVGANGSGKTTVLRLLARLLRPTSGTVTIADGTEIAYVAQQTYERWLPITGHEVLKMGAYGRRRLLGRLSAADRALLSDAAERMEIEPFLNQQFGELSGGQRQRVRIAQALVQGPDLLLLDEPITGLDLTSQQRILELIEEETARHTSIVVTTHNLDEARHCDQVLLLANRPVAFGRPDDVLTVSNLRAAFGDRVLGDHRHHGHPTEPLVIDDHGHRHIH